MYVCMYVCMYMYVYIYIIHILYIYIYILYIVVSCSDDVVMLIITMVKRAMVTHVFVKELLLW